MNTARTVRLVAVVIAVIAGLIAIPKAAVILALAGGIGGFFIESHRRLPFMVATLTLALTHGAFSPIPLAGIYLTDILGSLSALFNAAACTVVVLATVEGIRPSAARAPGTT